MRNTTKQKRFIKWFLSFLPCSCPLGLEIIFAQSPVDLLTRAKSSIEKKNNELKWSNKSGMKTVFDKMTVYYNEKIR